jgi:Fur family ferric uptake transcriptional regulator
MGDHLTVSTPGAMDRTEEIFREFMKSAGLPLSDEHRIIFQVFRSAEGHISPEQVYDIVHEGGVKIGIASIWRTLRLIHRAGLAEEHYFGKAGVHYEKKKAPQSHGHIVCNECGLTEEFDLSGFWSRINALALSQDFDLDDYELSLFGRCGECRQKIAMPVDESAGNNEAP